MRIKINCIYNLDFAYTRISISSNVEIDFRGVLSYHTKDIDLLSKVTGGILELDSVNVLNVRIFYSNYQELKHESVYLD